jgi:hypothetical protein
MSNEYSHKENYNNYLKQGRDPNGLILKEQIEFFISKLRKSGFPVLKSFMELKPLKPFSKTYNAGPSYASIPKYIQSIIDSMNITEQHKNALKDRRGSELIVNMRNGKFGPDRAYKTKHYVKQYKEIGLDVILAFDEGYTGISPNIYLTFNDRDDPNIVKILDKVYGAAIQAIVNKENAAKQKAAQEKATREEMLVKDNTYNIDENVGWATVNSITVSGGEVTEARLTLSNGKKVVYTDKTGRNALANTLKELAESETLTPGDFREETKTYKILSSVVTASSYLLDLVKLSNHLDKINLKKEADFLDKIIKEAGDRLLDQLTPELEEEAEEKEEVEDQVNFG